MLGALSMVIQYLNHQGYNQSSEFWLVSIKPHVYVEYIYILDIKLDICF